MNSAFDRPGIRPLSSASFASVPTPMMVAIASKNPASTSVKTIMPTVIAPTSPQPPNSRLPKSEKSGMETALPCSSGAPLAHCLGSMTPVAFRIAATIVPVTMPIRMAPGRLRAWSMKISSRVPAKSRTGQPASSPAGPRVSGVASPGWTKPPLTRPMMAMNRPMPMVMPCLRASGIAFMIISRSPVTTSSMITTPYITHMPMACGQVICGTTCPAITPDTESPAARASGTLPTKPIRSVVTAAASAVAVIRAFWPRVSPAASLPDRITGLRRTM